jgi:glutamyl-tRNA synthetase
MMQSDIVVRFAPSPTGALHIGSVRTALFNWLFARRYGGQFLLRIEDTDKLRSTPENTTLIFDILAWLGLDFDGDAVIQSYRIDRHKEVATNLVRNGFAYYCYCSADELAQKKQKAIDNGQPYKYDRACRNENVLRAGIKPVIRLKSAMDGTITVNDLVQGTVTIDNSQLDDFVLLRSDGSPTYMLSVVVDDHDMGITHVIRGDDHLTNTFKQVQIYNACGWNVPTFGHIPLIYGPDGAKLSKRHGAISAVEYKNLGYLPDAILNYLLRLGWSHGDHEIISKTNAIAWFDFDCVGKSPSRFDINKLNFLNAYYLRQMANKDLMTHLKPFLSSYNVSKIIEDRILNGIGSLKKRSENLVDLSNACSIYIDAPKNFDEKCSKFRSPKHIELLQKFSCLLRSSQDLSENALFEKTKKFAEEEGAKLVEIAQALRSALTGSTVSPSVFEVMEILGQEETLRRIETFIEWKFQ